MLEIEKECRECNGDYYIAYHDFSQKACFRKEVFDKVISMPFETIECMAPAGYDEYLRQLYGDYMKLPSIEEQKQSGHPKHFVDLDHYRNLKEIKRICKH